MRPLKEKICITIDGDVLEKVRYEAERDDRSVSQYINMVLKRHMARLEQKAAQKEAQAGKDKQ